MTRMLFAILLSSLVAGCGLGFDAVGTLRKVDSNEGVVQIFANGQERTVKTAKDVKVLGVDGKPLAEGLKAKELKAGVEVTVTVDRIDNRAVITAIRLGRQRPGGAEAPQGGKNSVGFKPLTERTAADKY